MLKLQTSDTTLNAGENFKIELFITGAGDINLSKILVSIPEYIVKDRRVKFTSVDYSLIDSNKKIFHPSLEIQEEEPSFYMLPSPIMYMYFGAENENFSIKPHIGGEMIYQLNGTNYAPYTIDFAIANNASAGDRDILISFIYKYGGKWYQDSKTIRLHINHWYEKRFWQDFLQLTILLGFALTLLLLLKEIWSIRAWFIGAFR